MNQFIKFCTIILLIGMVSCGESEISMVYNETQCADPWNTSSGDTDLEVKDAVDKHFNDLGINVSEIRLTSDGPLAACLACSCTSDRRIHLKVDEADRKVLEDLGFKEE